MMPGLGHLTLIVIRRHSERCQRSIRKTAISESLRYTVCTSRHALTLTTSEISHAKPFHGVPRLSHTHNSQFRPN